MNATRIGTLALVVLLSACASKRVSTTQARVTTAAATPLSDLNLVRDEIPEVLRNALKQPYLTTADATCLVITTEVHQLNEVLGADLDAPANPDEPSLLDRGTDAAEDTAIGAIQRTAEGLVPFRSWVRKLSGAERHSRKMAAAIMAGSIRRAFLKGVASAQGCMIKPPAQPVQLVATSTPATPAAIPAAAPASTPASGASSDKAETCGAPAAPHCSGPSSP